jgi:hypothetical protein
VCWLESTPCSWWMHSGFIWWPTDYCWALSLMASRVLLSSEDWHIVMLCSLFHLQRIQYKASSLTTVTYYHICFKATYLKCDIFGP